MISLAVGDKGKLGNWWHVLNLVVSSIPGRGLKTFEYVVLDRIVAQTCLVDGSAQSCGPEIDVEGNIIHEFVPHPKQSSLEQLPAVSMFAFDALQHKCGQLVAIGFTVRDCVTNDELSEASFAVDCTASSCAEEKVSAA